MMKKIYIGAWKKDLSAKWINGTEIRGKDKPICEISFFARFLEEGRLDVISKSYERFFEEVENRGFKPSEVFVYTNFEDDYFAET